MTTSPVFATTVQKTEEWLNELQQKLHLEDDRKAYQALRATLQALRDRLPAGEAADLGAQLPMLVRGFYYEGWKPDAPPVSVRDPQEFYELVRQHAPNVDQDVIGDTPRVVEAVFALLKEKVSAGEVEDLRRVLPEEMRQLWEAEA